MPGTRKMAGIAGTRRGKESFHYDLISITVMKLRTSNKLLSNSNIYGVNDNDLFFSKGNILLQEDI